MDLIFVANLTQSKSSLDYQPILEKILSIEKLDKIKIITNKKRYNAINDFLKNKNYNADISIVSLQKDHKASLIELINNVIVSDKIKDDLMVIFDNKLLSIDLNKVKIYFDAIKKPIIILYKSNSKKLVKKYGEYYLDDNGFIKSFREHVPTVKSGLISAGAFIFPKDSLFWFGKFLKSGSDKLNFGALIKKISQKRKVRGIVENEIMEI